MVTVAARFDRLPNLRPRQTATPNSAKQVTRRSQRMKDGNGRSCGRDSEDASVDPALQGAPPVRQLSAAGNGGACDADNDEESVMFRVDDPGPASCPELSGGGG